MKYIKLTICIVFLIFSLESLYSQKKPNDNFDGLLMKLTNYEGEFVFLDSFVLKNFVLCYDSFKNNPTIIFNKGKISITSYQAIKNLKDKDSIIMSRSFYIQEFSYHDNPQTSIISFVLNDKVIYYKYQFNFDLLILKLVINKTDY